MKRCKHAWEPLIRSKVPLDWIEQLTFAMGANGLQHYDRCRLCGRLSFRRTLRRNLVSCDAKRLIYRAARFDEWWEKEGKKEKTNA